MADPEELEKLSTRELHDRAVRLAERRLDLRFLWRLLRAIPVAEAATGELQEADMHVTAGDVANVVETIRDWDQAGEGELGEALRPMYIEYLVEHE
jgi:hypothetical protein